jgi:hypothetical protein
MDTQAFAHLTYGELAKQFGRETTLTLGPWDKLPSGDREKWMSALAVVHSKILPHGTPVENYPSIAATGRNEAP